MSTDTENALRAWAKGIYPLEAGVELLLRSGFAGPSRPWVQPGETPGRYWIDVDQITPDTIGVYSGGEQRILRIVAALMNGEPVSLYEALPGLDRDNLALVLAAIAHAGGSHEHVSLRPEPAPEDPFPTSGVRSSYRHLGSLYPWPA